MVCDHFQRCDWRRWLGKNGRLLWEVIFLSFNLHFFSFSSSFFFFSFSWRNFFSSFFFFFFFFFCFLQSFGQQVMWRKKKKSEGWFCSRTIRVAASLFWWPRCYYLWKSFRYENLDLQFSETENWTIRLLCDFSPQQKKNLRPWWWHQMTAIGTQNLCSFSK